jgi:hypothetical protein
MSFNPLHFQSTHDEPHPRVQLALGHVRRLVLLQRGAQRLRFLGGGRGRVARQRGFRCRGRRALRRAAQPGQLQLGLRRGPACTYGSSSGMLLLLNYKSYTWGWPCCGALDLSQGMPMLHACICRAGAACVTAG